MGISSFENVGTVPLKLLIETSEEEEKAFRLLGGFACEKNMDVQNFIRKIAIPFEKAQKAKTYLLFCNGTGPLCGYFSLSMSCISLEHVDGLSKNKKKELYGMFVPQKPFACYLIGQLARDDRFSADALSGSEIIERALGYIKLAQGYVAGRLVLVECFNELIPYYEKNGFVRLSEDGKLHQMYRMIN